MAADLLVRGAVALARRGRVSPTLVAATIVALGTSLPELVVAVRATLTGHPEMLLGNVIGSNTANVLLVVGAAAVVAPLAIDGPGQRRDSFSMTGVTLVFLLMCLTTGLTRQAGALLLLGFFMVWAFAARESVLERRSRVDEPPLTWVLGLPRQLPMIAVFIALGVIGLPLGARLVVDAAAEIAARLGVTEAVVGLTIIAFSTSLPELATTVVAAYQKRADVAVAGVLGSNILNLVGIMGISAVISASPIRVPAAIRILDLPVMVGATLMLTIVIWLRKPIGRPVGVIWVAAYVAYIAALFVAA
jgi:cation:H+ antiporter